MPNKQMSPAKQGDKAVFKCGRTILRGCIVKKEEGSLAKVLQEDNYTKIIPSTRSLSEATEYIRRLYGTTEGIFTAYSFALD